MRRSRTRLSIIMILFAAFLSVTSAYGQQLTTYRGTGDDYAYSIQQTQDGGYVVAGYTDSYGVGSYDLWIMRLDSAGATTWQKTYGGTGTDYVTCPGDCEELYGLNAPVTLTATAGPGSTFVKWTGNPCKDVTTNVCTLTMDKNVTVKAVFELSP